MITAPAGYLLSRFAGASADAATIARLVTELVETDPRNALPEGDHLPIWAPPVIGIAAADDPLFATLRQPGVVGPIHRDPEAWLPGARSVISFFLPFSDAIKACYRPKRKLPPLPWVSGRLNGEVFVNLTRRTIAAWLRRLGGRAVVPTLERHYHAVDLKPMWSERHVAYIAGVGTFGLSAGLLTVKGGAGRLGSVVTDLAIAPTPRAYEGPFDYCPKLVDGTCGACIYTCPAGAIDEHGKNHLRCLEYGADNILPAYSAWGYHSCGHCQTNLPCTDGLAPRIRRRLAKQSDRPGR